MGGDGPTATRRGRGRRVGGLFVVALMLAGVAAVGVPQRGLAATFTVTSTADAPDTNRLDGVCVATTGGCTLRAAIVQASSFPGSTVEVPAGTYRLTIQGYPGLETPDHGDLDVTAAMTIRGAGASQTIIDATGLGDRAMELSARGSQVRIEGVTIRGGQAPPGRIGGGIASSAELTLVNSRLEGNAAEAGGGICVTFGSAVIRDTVIGGNSAVQAGGGVQVNVDSTELRMEGGALTGNSAVSGGGVANYGTLIVRGTTLSGNQVTRQGGGIVSFGALDVEGAGISGNTAQRGGGIFVGVGSAGVTATVISGNTAQQGGGIYLERTAQLTVLGTTVDSNTGTDEGGGFAMVAGSLTLRRSTISRNDAHIGGGIAARDPVSLRLENSTVSSNSAEIRPGGIWLYGASAAIEFSTVAGNSVRSAGEGQQALATGSVSFLGSIVDGSCVLSIVAGTGNVFADSSCAPPGPGNVVGDPRLGPLADNGGATRTHLPAAGSPALDRAGTAGCPVVDQRALPRPRGAACDAGSVEIQGGGGGLTHRRFSPGLQWQ